MCVGVDGCRRPGATPNGQCHRLGMTVIAPISQDGNFARIHGFCVSLSGSGTKTQGVVMVNGVRTLDLSARAAKKKKKLFLGLLWTKQLPSWKAS